MFGGWLFLCIVSLCVVLFVMVGVVIGIGIDELVGW